jgi:hypothetical protein
MPVLQRIAFHCLGLLTLGVGNVAPGYAQILDASFGDRGQLTEGFAMVSGRDDDFALAACATPGGTLTVYGTASGSVRVVTLRLRSDGGLDASFSGDGKESFDWPGERISHRERVGLCMSNGDAVLAQPALEAGDERIVLVRVQAQTGLPDPAWGSGGFVVLDLDALGTELAQRETPLGLNLAADGGVYLTGDVALSNGGTRGFAVRIDPAGTVRAAAIYRQDQYWRFGLAAAAEAPDGNVWLSGRAVPASNGLPTFLRLRVDPQTLALVQALPGSAPLDRVGRGRMVAPGVFASVAHRREPGAADVPVLLLHRESGTNVLELPALLPVLGQPGKQLPHDQDGDVIPLPDGSVLVTGTAGLDNDIGGKALYQIRVLLAAGGEPDRVDTRFGIGGIWQFSRLQPGCSQPNDQSMRRTTLWNGRVTVVGAARTQNCTNNEDHDYWVLRMQIDALHIDGFE